MNDRLVKFLPFSKNLLCVIASSRGKGFVAALHNIQTSQKKGKQLFNLKDEDHLIKVIELSKSHLACVNSEAKLLIFETKTLPILQKGGGVQLQKIKTNIQLKDIQNFNLEQGINWKTGSLNKNEKLLDFWIGKRAQSGKKVPKRFNKNLIFNDYDQ